MEKFRQGIDPSLFAHPEKPKKTIRGFVPKFLHLDSYNTYTKLIDEVLLYKTGNASALEDIRDFSYLYPHIFIVRSSSYTFRLFISVNHQIMSLKSPYNTYAYTTMILTKYNYELSISIIHGFCCCILLL